MDSRLSLFFKDESSLMLAHLSPEMTDKDQVADDLAPLVILDGVSRSQTEMEVPAHSQFNGHFIGTVSEGGFRIGNLNIRDYEKDFKKLRSENYNLKLRIFILEERYGLLPKSAEKEDIYRINLDLKVENESMRKDLENKTQLLQEALEQIEDQERERLRDQQQFIESLRQTTLSTFTNGNSGDTLSTNKPNNELNVSTLSNVEIREPSNALLVEAFGSMNLAHNDDLLEKLEEQQKTCGSQKEQIQKLQEEKKTLAKEVTEKNELLTHESEMAKEGLEKFKELQKAWANQKEEVQTLQEDKENLAKKVTELQRGVSVFQLQVIEKERNIHILEQQLWNIENQNQTKSLEGVKIMQLEEEIANLKLKLNETEAQANVQINALKEVNFNKSESITVLEQRVTVREEALAKLKKEYERVKDIVRKYREVKNASQDNHYLSEIEILRSSELALKSEIEQLKNHNTNTDQCQNQTKNLEEVKIIQLEEEIANLKLKLNETEAQANVQINALKEVNFNMNENITVLEQRVTVREEALAKLKEEYERVKDKVRKYREVKNASQDNHYLNEIEILRSSELALKSEIEQLKNHSTTNDIHVAMKHAANLTMKEISKAYQKAAIDYSMKMQDVLQLFHTNLRDVVEFLQHLLSLESKGQLDLSCLSDSVRNVLQKSLDGGRRLSQISSILEDVDETQASFFGGGVQLPELNLPYVEIQLNNEVIVSNLEQELQENINADHAAYQVEMTSLKVKLEECPMQLRNARRGCKDSDNQSYRTAKSADSDSLSQPDKIISQSRIKSLHQASSSKNNYEDIGSNTSSEVSTDKSTAQRLKAQVLHLESRLCSQEEKNNHNLEEARLKFDAAKERVKLLISEKNELIDNAESIKAELSENISSLQNELNHKVKENQILVKKNQELTKESKINSDIHEKMAKKICDLNEQVQLEKEKCLNISENIKAQTNQNKDLEQENHMLQDLVKQQKLEAQDATKLIKELEEKNHEHRAKLFRCQNQTLEVSSVSQEQVADDNRRQDSFKGINNISRDGRGEEFKPHVSCGCQSRIEELERLLEKANKMYKQDVEARKDHKAAMDKAIVKQIKKTNKFLKQINLSSDYEPNFKS